LVSARKTNTEGLEQLKTKANGASAMAERSTCFASEWAIVNYLERQY
jgi:hypothetical protein